MSSSVERVCALLVDAHREFRQIEAMPAGATIATREQAYAIQDCVANAMGGAGGWKTGAPAPDAEPIAAPLFASWIGPGPATLPASRFHGIGVEAEFAFRFARALPARDRAWSRDEVLAAIEALVPAIEVVDSRLGAWAHGEPLWKLADNQSNGYLVYGQPIASWRGIDLARFPVELWIDGVCVVRGEDSANPAGDPLRLVGWLANHLSATRAGLAAGAIVTTGSYTGLRQVRPGQRVLARYPGLGEVEVVFTPD
jgi:2-keto-4-pentenoate hydratase